MERKIRTLYRSNQNWVLLFLFHSRLQHFDKDENWRNKTLIETHARISKYHFNSSLVDAEEEKTSCPLFALRVACRDLNKWQYLVVKNIKLPTDFTDVDSALTIISN